MNMFTILKKQVKACINAELTSEPEIRKCFDWRFVVKVGEVDYLVGKTAENTCYYQGPTDKELVGCFPEQLLDKIEEWSEPEFGSYSIVSADKVCGTSDLETCLKQLPKKFQQLYIVGNRKNGKAIKLYKLKKGLKGIRWVKLEKKS